MLTPMIADSEIGVSTTRSVAELLVQSLRRAEGAAIGADILAEHEDLRVAPHFFGERFADGVEIGQLLAHISFESTQSLVFDQRYA